MVDRRDLAEDRAGPEIAEDDLVPVGRIELGPDMTLEDHIDFGAERAEAEDGLAGAGLDAARVRRKLAPARLGQPQSQRRKLGYPRSEEPTSELPTTILISISGLRL